MISVTVAAQGKKQRLVGGHLKAYGSGRLSIVDLDKTDDLKPEDHHINIWARAFTKVLDVVYTVLVSCFPFVFNFLNAPSDTDDDEMGDRKARINRRSLSVVKYSAVQILDGKALGRIFAHLDPIDITKCELVSTKWKRAVEDNIDKLPKIQKDQIRFLFDEGEVVVYPVDEKKCPRKYQMPSLQILSRRLRHLSCLSLFVRGLIPVEAVPVLKALTDLSLSPQQIYLIWCKFSPTSATYLADFLNSNAHSLTDLGLEECTPGWMISDELLTLTLKTPIVSLRIWNDGKSGTFAISDATVLALADSVRGGCPLETVDLACTSVSSSSVVALIEAWTHSANSDLSISLNYCPLVNFCDMMVLLAAREIYPKQGKIRRRGHCLSLFV